VAVIGDVIARKVSRMFRFRITEYIDIMLPVALGVVIGSGIAHYLHW